MVAGLQAARLSVSVLGPAQAGYFVKRQQRRNKEGNADVLCLAVYARERRPALSLPSSYLAQSLTREVQGSRRTWPA